MEENKDVEKENSVVPESYVREWYYNWFEDMKEIYKGHFKNPAELSQYNQAYIDGIVQNYDEKNAKEIKKPLQEIATAYEQQSLADFNSGSRQNAVEQDKVSVQQSFDMAINSYKDEEPLNVQTIKTALHTKILNDNVKSGIITQEFYNKEVSRFGKEVIIQNLVSVMGAKNVSMSSKFEIAKRFMEGHTGEESVDFRMAPSERITAVLQALNANSQMRAMEKQYEKELEDARVSAFELKYRQAAMYLATSGTKDPKVIRQLQQSLYPLAGVNDFDKVANIGSLTYPKTTSPTTQMIISDKKRNGKWDVNALDELVFSGQVSGSDAEQLYRELEHPIFLNQKLVESVENRLKSETGWTPNGDQRLLNSFRADFLSDENVRTKILSEQEALAVAENAYNNTMKKAPLSKEALLASSYKTYEEIGLPIENANDLFSTAKVEAQKELNTENATFEQIEPYLKKKLLSNIEYRKNTDRMPTIYDGDGNVVTDNNLIVALQLAIIKKEKQKGVKNE